MDGRRLAVAWDYMRDFEHTALADGELARLEPEAADGVRREADESGGGRARMASAEGARAAGGSLFVPPRTRLDYYLEAQPGSVMTFDSVSAPAPEASLTIEMRQVGGEQRIMKTLRGPAAFDAIPLGNDQAEIVRLSFHVRSSGSSDTHSEGVTVTGPVLRSRERSDGPQSTAAGGDTRTIRRPNILIYLIDALRADHLGCYGYDKDISPNIDRFAKDATVFRRAIAQSPWTKASVASIFTGLSPRVHGVQGRHDALADEADTLADELTSAGYRTVSVTTNGWVTSPFGFDQGVQRFFYLTDARTGSPLSSVDLNRVFFGWLDTNVAARPVFAYIHSVDPHSPYEPPEEYRQKFAPWVADRDIGTLAYLRRIYKGEIPENDVPVRALVALYDAEIAFNDDSFGTFVRELKRRGLYDDAFIIFVADHGEEFFEHHALEHGQDLYSDVLNIPLIIKFPAGDGPFRRDVTTPVQQTDLLPTVLDYLGVRRPEALEGRSLVGIASTRDIAKGERSVLSYMKLDGMRAESVIRGSWKLIRSWKPNGRDFRLELYDNRETIRDENEVLRQDPERRGFQMSEIKSGELGEKVPAVVRHVSDEERRDEEALGYGKGGSTVQQ